MQAIKNLVHFLLGFIRKENFSIRGKLLIGIILFAGLPITLMGLAAQFSINHQLQKELKVNSEASYAIIKNQIWNYRDKALSEAVVIADTRTVYDAILNKKLDDLKLIAFKLLSITKADILTITDEKGVVLLRAHDPERSGDSIISEPRIKKAVVESQSSNEIVDSGSKVYVLATVPILNWVVNGTITIGYSLDEKLLSQIHENTGKHVALLKLDDGKPTLLSHSFPHDFPIKYSRLNNAILNSNSMQYFEQMVNGDDFEVAFSYLVPASSIILMVISSVTPWQSIVWKSESLFLALTIISIFLVFVIGYFAIQRILRPINRLLDIAKQEGLGSKPISDELQKDTDMFNVIGSAIQRLTKEVEKNAATTAIGKVALQVAHDICSPLSSMQAALEYLGKMNIVDPKAPEVLNLLELSAKRLTGIADDLLKRHKGDGAAKTLFSLHQVLDELAGEYQSREEFKSVRFVKEYQSEAISLYGDRTRLQRAFGNIIKNAVEAMERRGEITLRTSKPNGKVEVSIADTGPGIPSDKLQLILAGGFTEGKEDGHGIGMKVVRETVEEFGGKLNARSELGKGTAFFIELPIHVVEEVFTLEIADAKTPVLVVDDEPSMREQWRLALNACEVETILCDSYEDVVGQKLSAVLVQTAIIDYHFDNSEKSGADIVQYLQVQGMRDIVLCTAEYWKPSVQKLAQELQVTLCPKPLPKIKLRTTDQGPGTRDQNRSTHNPSTKLRAGAPRSTKKGYKVLVIDDDEGIRLSWNLMKQKLGISTLYCFSSLEALELEKDGFDLSTLDIAFVDKNIEGSKYSGADVVNYLKARQTKKVVLASGENKEKLRQDPAFAQADFIVNDKAPSSCKKFFS